jgi:pilus assembly protein CpaE
MPRPRAQEAGQATVEFLGLLPLLVLIALLGWQALVAGQAAWLAGSAAREAARARALGHDPLAAARRALPPRLRTDLHVSRDGDDGVRLRVAVPLVVHTTRHLGTVSARARMEPQA